MNTDPRKPVQTDEETREAPRELPRYEDETEVNRKHFPSPGQDSKIPHLPEGQTDAPPA